jgi:hypothetical protein
VQTLLAAASHAGYLTFQKLQAPVRTKRAREARKVAEEAVNEAAKWGDVMALGAVSAALRAGAKGDKDLVALALRAAEGMVAAAGENDAPALLNLAATYHAVGDKAKAKGYLKKAVEPPSKGPPELRRYVEQEAKKFNAGENERAK